MSNTEEKVTLGKMLQEAVDTIIVDDVVQHEWAEFTYQFRFTARKSLKDGTVYVNDLTLSGPLQVGDARIYEEGNTEERNMVQASIKRSLQQRGH